MKEGLHENCKLACSCAISQLDEVSRQLREGDITIEELKIIHNKHLEQMERLYEARIPKHTQASNLLNSVIKMRLEEYEVFQDSLGHLQHLCQMIAHDVGGKMRNLYLLQVYLLLFIPSSSRDF